MRRSFLGVLWASFRSVYGPVLAVVGLLIAVILYVFSFQDDLGARLLLTSVVVLFLLMLVLLFTFVSAAFTMYEAAGRTLPRVIHGRDTFQGIEAVLICVLEPSALFSTGILVSLHNVDRQGIEVPIGVGNVVNVQDDGKIQVAVTDVVPGHEAEADKLREGRAEALDSTRVRPNVPRQMYESRSRGRS